MIKTIRDLKQNDQKNNVDKKQDKVNIVLISETWITPSETNIIYEKRLGMQTFSTSRPNKTGGGVMIAIDVNTTIEKVWKYTDDHSSYIGIFAPAYNLFIISCYIPPDNNCIKAMEGLDQMKDFITQGDKESRIYIYGDFNLNVLNYSHDNEGRYEPTIKGLNQETNEDLENPEKLEGINGERAIAHKLIAIADELDLDQIVMKPTYKKPKDEGKSYLDRIYTNIRNCSNVEHIETRKTRHDFLKTNAEIRVVMGEEQDDPKEEIKRLNTKNVNYTEVLEQLPTNKWKQESEELTSDNALKTMTDDIINCLLNNGAKWVTNRKAGTKHPNPDINKLHKKANHLKRKIGKITKGLVRTAMISELAHLIEEIENKEEELEDENERTKLQELSKHNKGLFEIIKNFKRENNKIGALRDSEGKLVHSESKKRQMFEEYYKSLEANPKPEHVITDWNEIFKETDDNKPKLSKITIDEEDVKNVIKEMKKNTAPGIDCITSTICLELKDEIAPALTRIFNKALTERTPLYKEIEVIISTLFKGGNRTEIKQYRPLSLLPMFLRIFDKCLFKKIDEHLENHNLLSDHQYGGRKSRNTVSLVSRLMFKAAELFKGNEGEIVLVVCYDQAKFFDKIEKNQLLKACKNIGIQGDILFQINEIIKNRKIKVKVNNKLSEGVKLENGAPQGLSMSLPLSSIYTNGVEEYLKSAKKETQADKLIETDFGIYVDDLTLIIYTTNSDEGITAAQKIVDLIYKYFADRNLKLNYDKIKILCIRRKQDSLPKLCITDPKGMKIEYVPNINMLGINWNEFGNKELLLEKTLMKAKRAFFMIQGILKTKKIEIHLIAYKAIILGIIQYSVGMLGNMSGAQRKKLEATQKMMITWMYRKLETEENHTNNATLWITKGTEEAAKEMEKTIEVKHESTYKEKLEELNMFPITHRVDRNIIQVAADGATGRLIIPYIKIKEPKSERLGPFLEIDVKKERKRPNIYKREMERSMIQTGVTMFNKLNTQIRNQMNNKEHFKLFLSTYLKNIDVLDHKNIPTETLKLDNQILYHK